MIRRRRKDSKLTLGREAFLANAIRRERKYRTETASWGVTKAAINKWRQIIRQRQKQ